MLNVQLCRLRQNRLLNVISRQNLAGALITQRDHVYYFTGYRSHWNHAPAMFIDARGHVTLSGNNVNPKTTAADEILNYPAQKHSTMPPDQAWHSAEMLSRAIQIEGRAGFDGEGRAAFLRLIPEPVDLTRHILRLRKRKDPDEIECIKAAIAISDVMYEMARNVVQPGVTELEAYTHIRSAAIRAAGQELEHFGNDFRANAGGGSPRNRAMEFGELYVLDAGPSLYGYHADNCRTFAVNRQPTDLQYTAWQKLVACLSMLEMNIRPGVSGTQLYEMARVFLQDAGHSGLCHHLGHGIGLQPHESPQLNPEFPEAMLEVGDVFTMEPGLYSDALAGGIRLEQNYLVLENGFERLTSYPLDL
ncbi:MAG TPA: Xaa-Pro peptidase family protein [Planctomycetota bacterium]|nr:Xaa-Pro peptidase family protein [Planctomycetota bacterium]